MLVRVADGMIDMRRDVGMRLVAQHADAGEMRLGALAVQRDLQFGARQLGAAIERDARDRRRSRATVTAISSTCTASAARGACGHA